MQQQREEVDHFQEELKMAKEERDRAMDEISEMKRQGIATVLPSRSTIAIYKELSAVNKSLSDSSHNLRVKEEAINSLKTDLKIANLSFQSSTNILKDEIFNAKASEKRALEEIRELHSEIEKMRESETKTYNSLVNQTKLAEQTQMNLKESELKVSSLREKTSHLESLECELQLTKEELEREKSLKNDLKFAFEADRKSKKAMDDLAIALKEVTTEACIVKDRLSLSETELVRTKELVQSLTQENKKTRETYETQLAKCMSDNDKLKNVIQRLRAEAEETLLAWNGKEMGLVSCLKRAEDECAATHLEKTKVIEFIKACEMKTQTSREENHKLRDILKQALNEANIAKETAAIAAAENSELKNCLNEKDSALSTLTRQIETNRINEVAAKENIKELKRLLSVAAANHKQKVGLMEEHLLINRESDTGKKLSKALSFDQIKLKVQEENEDHVKTEALRGSIFDTVEDSAVKEESFLIGDVEETVGAGCDHVSFEDVENGRSMMRKKRALLHKFGNLLRRSSFHHRKESSLYME